MERVLPGFENLTGFSPPLLSRVSDHIPGPGIQGQTRSAIASRCLQMMPDARSSPISPDSAASAGRCSRARAIPPSFFTGGWRRHDSRLLLPAQTTVAAKRCSVATGICIAGVRALLPFRRPGAQQVCLVFRPKQSYSCLNGGAAQPAIPRRRGVVRDLPDVQRTGEIPSDAGSGFRAALKRLWTAPDRL